MTMKNYMEDVVKEILQDLVKVQPIHCQCERCRNDIIALALSSLRGKYATTPQGEILARVEQSDRQVRTDALLAVMQAIDIVREKPRHRGPEK
ncbi:MAG TPA: late competence development ComFB family protein [Firmicutes bacterium]|mgnify:CR=1 FL=1|jgi:competence protein ComFB|nr:late competence development ComFB family protein [Bacillota bacterium]